MARCPHQNIQQYTECCNGCGRNAYEMDAAYEQYLYERLYGSRNDRIEAMERKLGISHSGNADQIDWRAVDGY